MRGLFAKSPQPPKTFEPVPPAKRLRARWQKSRDASALFAKKSLQKSPKSTSCRAGNAVSFLHGIFFFPHGTGGESPSHAAGLLCLKGTVRVSGCGLSAQAAPAPAPFPAGPPPGRCPPDSVKGTVRKEHGPTVGAPQPGSAPSVAQPMPPLVWALAFLRSGFVHYPNFCSKKTCFMYKKLRNPVFFCQNLLHPAQEHVIM